MHNFTKNHKEHLVVLPFKECFELQKYEVFHDIGLFGESRILLFKKNENDAKYVLIKSFDTEEAQDKIENLGFGFKVIQNSQKELDILLEEIK
jgi:hypothetical protein